MKLWLLSILLVYCSSAVAQQTIYQSFDVDSVATPRGDMAFFNTYLQANLRKPIRAEATGIDGRIVMTGVVELNGSVSGVKVMNSIHPDLDREAIRVFSLFNAWKPAQKSGQPVRQQVTFPILFKPNTPFSYVGGARVDYFSSDGKPVIADSSLATFKRVAPIDTNGIPSGDVVVYQLKTKSWKEYFRVPLVRKKSGSHTVLVGNQTSGKEWEGQVVILNEAGLVVNRTYYEDGKPAGPQLSYHANGVVSKKKEDLNDRSAIMTWYMNGQIKEMKVGIDPYILAQGTPDQVTAFWDSTGYAMVKNGNGQATYKILKESLSDTAHHTLFVEQGLYENGFKQGIWTGRYADGSYFYEENYDKGICLGGKARSAAADTVRYSSIDQQPEFPGGMDGLGQFLSKNLSYPRNAQQAGAEGKVFVSFVVCTDGTLCDYEVWKSVHPDLDKEAVRVVQKMSGRWKPGFQRGQKVRVKYSLPINFTLN